MPALREVTPSVELWEASPLGDLTLESLRPEAGLPQGVPRSSVTRRDLTPSALLQRRIDVDETNRSVGLSSENHLNRRFE